MARWFSAFLSEGAFRFRPNITIEPIEEIEDDELPEEFEVVIPDEAASTAAETDVEVRRQSQQFDLAHMPTMASWKTRTKRMFP